MLKPISEVERLSLKICVYGKSGTGKTYSCSTIPEKYSVVFVNVDNKLASLPEEFRKRSNVFMTEPITTPNEYSAAIREIANHKFDVVVIDSFTFVQQRIAEALSSAYEDPQKRLQYYDKLMRQTINALDFTINKLKDKTVIFTLLEDVDGLTGKYNGEIMLTGKAKTLLPSRFDVIMYSFVEKRNYKWRIRSEENLCKIVPHMWHLDDEIPQDYGLIINATPYNGGHTSTEIATADETNE
jgi:Cdc6-like AAA superfamily ATPase